MDFWRGVGGNPKQTFYIMLVKVVLIYGCMNQNFRLPHLFSVYFYSSSFNWFLHKRPKDFGISMQK